MKSITCFFYSCPCVSRCDGVHAASSFAGRARPAEYCEELETRALQTKNRPSEPNPLLGSWHFAVSGTSDTSTLIRCLIDKYQVSIRFNLHLDELSPSRTLARPTVPNPAF
jgi:hypothetical protein